MHGGKPNPDPSIVRRVELILQQLDSLPTLSAVAVRLLELTTAEDTHADDVIELVAADPSLSSKVLKLCRCHARGRASDVRTIDRAVLLLGFDAVRSAVLSIQVFELFDGLQSPGGEVRSTRMAFDRQLFWQHSLAVGTVSEFIAEASKLRHTMSHSEAFVAGLLHDLGALALHVVLPRSLDRVCELAEAHGVPLDRACRHIIGLDTHTAGKRLAEHWHLPDSLRDTMWLNGQPIDSLPDLEHAPLIGLVTLADAIVRRQHIAPLGHGPQGEDIAEMCDQLGIRASHVDDLLPALHDQVASRAGVLGVDFEHSTDLLLRSIMRANEILGRMNSTMRQRARVARRQSRTLGAISRFYESLVPGSLVVSTLGAVVRSLADAFGGSFFSVLHRAASNDPWQFYRFAADGRMLLSEVLVAPAHPALPETMLEQPGVPRAVLEMLPSLREQLCEPGDFGGLKLLPLACGWGVTTVVLHDSELGRNGKRAELTGLCRTWGAAVAAATQHEDAQSLSERLAESNRALVATQDALTMSQTMAALGELAAGAAHEMNNPLTVISGRSQLLASRLTEEDLRSMAEQIEVQSHRLSDIITALRSFAEPSAPKICAVDVADLVVREVQQIQPIRRRSAQINTRLAPDIPNAHIDPDQIGCALSEILRNAVEAEGSRHVEVRVQIDPLDDRLKLQVTDDGSGLSDHALTHAFDPFFSAKAAGRQPGLGLSRARRLVEAHGGSITLENGATGGAVATIWLSDWREESDAREAA